LSLGFNLYEAKLKQLTLFHLLFPNRAIPRVELPWDSPPTLKNKDPNLINLLEHSLQQLNKK
jgi:hypothetical protein